MEWYEEHWPHVGPELKKMEAEKYLDPKHCEEAERAWRQCLPKSCPTCREYLRQISILEVKAADDQRIIDDLRLRLHQAQEHERLSLTRRDGFNTTNVG